MQLQSQIKVMNAGFTILRCDDSPSPRIKYKAEGNREWKTYHKFDSKAERDRTFKKLINEVDNYMED